MQTTAIRTETVTYAGFTATATEYGRHQSDGPFEWRVNLNNSGIGTGTLRADSLEGIHDEFVEFITEALADQALAAAEQYATYDFSDLIDDDGYDLEGGW